jgi:S-adenosylmethionine:tRNA ribosyltransferase-isomerase
MIAASRLDYTLPPELIAQAPAGRRDASRLLVVDRANRALSHRLFRDLPEYLRSGDTLFRNNASVLPARLHGRRASGGQVELLLLRRSGTPRGGKEVWRCLVRPARKLAVGERFEVAGGALTAVIAADLAEGTMLVRLTSPTGESVMDAANRLGDIPLPPYIERKDQSGREEDRQRYQTVYADSTRQVAVAAPTAGLHFTPGLLAEIAAHGVHTADLTLHVGLGTFRAISSETVEAHPIHSELYEIPESTQRALFPPLPGRRVAVGTTTVRSIEDFLTNHDAPVGHTHLSEAGLYLYPPRKFKGVDALVTNFHQPRSTLLALVAAFLTPGSTDGIDWLMDIYAQAVAERYRFFSYGDAMLVL